MKVGIIGTRGVPNNYGGFEQFAQYLSMGLAEMGVDVWVYNSHYHPYKKNRWNDVNIIHCFDPEQTVGTAGQFIYDMICIIDSRKRNFDIILQLGYTSSTIWHWLLSKGVKIVTNMDGLEWKRSKYPKSIRQFLRYAEKLAVKTSDVLIADSQAIQSYILDDYGVNSVFIPYGAHLYENQNNNLLKQYGVTSKGYFLLIARMQPDNHIEEIIRGVLQSNTDFPLLVVGNVNNKFGKYLQKTYSGPKIQFKGAIFDSDLLNQLRYNAACYFHGHSAGGTNPSLLEAMAASAFICAHCNPFNKAVLGENALYFDNEHGITNMINRKLFTLKRDSFIKANIMSIKQKYSWYKVIKSYFDCFNKVIKP